MHEAHDPRLLPNEATLRYYAETGDARRIADILDWLRRTPTKGQELAETVRSAGLRLELSDTLGAAVYHLRELKQQRPDAEPGLPVGTTTILTFEAGIVQYGRQVTWDVMRAIDDLTDPEDPHDTLEYVKQSLVDERRQSLVLARLGIVAIDDDGSVRNRARLATVNMRNNLWGAVAAGHDFITETARISEDDPRLTIFKAYWSNEIDEAFNGAESELTTAREWMDI